MEFFLKAPTEYASEIAARAKTYRLAANLTQEELADRAGLTTITLRRFENTGNGSLETVIRIAMALNKQAEIEALFEVPTFVDVFGNKEDLTLDRKRARRK